MIDPARYDKARDQIAAAGFTPAIQTKIALLLCAAKNGNLMFQAGMQWAPDLGVAQQFLLSQSARELEAVALLNRTTRWSHDPALLLHGSRIVAPLSLAWSQVMLPPGPMFNPQAAYRGLSLGHAQLARIRLLAVIPDQADPLDPFVVALRRIEQENGRMLQTQIRLLKGIDIDTPIEEREARLEQDQQLVDRVFDDFLSWLAAP
jgi:hypothetical protein